jgi:hypothetical protein
MNRKLLTGLTLASVASTGGVAFAALAEPVGTTPSAPLSAAMTSALATSTTNAAGRTISYQVGDAGMVTVDIAGTVLTSRGLVPAAGWNIAALSNSGTHIDVQFANAERIVAFHADLVGADVVVSVTNDRVPGVSGPLDSLVVSTIGGSATPTTAPATPPTFDTVVPATPASVPVTTPTTVAPPVTSTTAPSSAETYDDDDGEYEYESNEAGHTGHHNESEDEDDD